VVVDPQRDPSQYLHEADQLGVDITFVLETHIHNGLRQRGPGARGERPGPLTRSPQAEPVSFPTSSALSVTVTSSPPASLRSRRWRRRATQLHHLAYLIRSRTTGTTMAEVSWCAPAAPCWSNSTGRTDLLGTALAEGLARAQWHSVRRLLTSLPKPPGSCRHTVSAASAPRRRRTGLLNGVQTIAQELEQNPAALLDEDDFVARLHDDPLPIPSYYRYMAPLNRKGPGRALFRARRRS